MGTFNVAFDLYFQLYTIHATYLNHILPVVYILLPGMHLLKYFFLKQFFVSSLCCLGKKQNLY